MRYEDSRWNLNIHYHRVAVEAIPAGARTALDVGSGDGVLALDLADCGLTVDCKYASEQTIVVCGTRGTSFGAYLRSTDPARADPSSSPVRHDDFAGQEWQVTVTGAAA